MSENLLDEILAPMMEMDPTHVAAAAAPARSLWTDQTTADEMDVIIGALEQIRDQLRAKGI